jgi:hypothetical protein
MEYAIGIPLMIAAVIYLIVKDKQKKKNKQDFLQSEGFNASEQINAGKYIGGHPDMDQPVQNVSLFFKGDELLLYCIYPTTHNAEKVGTIKKDSIKSIVVEDATTVEKRVTVGRLLAVGVFAFAMKKTEKHELAYMIISWNDGKFEHETIFEVIGGGAIEHANTVRNALIRGLR